jgi:hypothetical protein
MLLCGGLLASACTTDAPDTVSPMPSSSAVVATEAQCEPFVKAAEARWAAREQPDSLDVRPAARSEGPKRAGVDDQEILAEEVARLHHEVDVDINRLAAARTAWEDAKRALEVDSNALDQAIRDFENASD